MRTLRELLTTWENWSARDQLIRILAATVTDEQRAILRSALDDMPEVDPLHALRDSTELLALLTGWRWQAVHAARLNGASWEKIGEATGTAPEQAQADHRAAVARQERYGTADVEQYRRML